MRLLLFVFLIAVLAPTGFAADHPDASRPIRHFAPAPAARNAGLHARAATQADQPRSLIEQVRFNQKPLSFEHGVTVGPGAGNLEIQFVLPASHAEQRLRYRLLGFDKQWRIAGDDRLLHYHLVPGHYEFDFQTDSRRLRSSAVASIPITVTAPYWQTAPFRSLCVLFLLLLILLLHRLRVRYLSRHNQKLQETVNQTRAELTLTARSARDAQEALKEQALKDGLTGLWNRKEIFAMLERELYRAQRDHFPVTLAMIDLDHFKSVNDTYGHPTGDEVLREAAGRLIELMRPYDFIGRYGGEEFLVVLPSCSSHHGVQRAEEFRRAIAARPIFTPACQLTITCSIGVAAYDDAMPPDDLIHRADEALYRAKRLGRNCVCAGNQGAVVERGHGPRGDHSHADRARTAESG
ncbi:MAG TPA: GGDEF domain-containing protein [Acidobacteriaceae bacterium]|nr:GGDEF domain-containing protein [Acidobacteriaceae bacterium]